MSKTDVITSTNDEIKLKEYFVSPNPVNGKLFVKNLEESEDYRIFNTQGKIILNGNYTSSGIQTSDLAKGVYFLNVVNQVLKFQVK